MGKVRDEAPVARSAKPTPKGASGGKPSRVVEYLLNLLKFDVYKPNQGWYARVWTAVGLGVLLAAGIYMLYKTQLEGTATTPVRIGLPAALAAVFGWVVFRSVQFPPFVEFLAATEAEMNKVSWTSRDDLRRATIVVLVTVVLMALFLFGVDTIWAQLLRVFGVLKFAPATPDG